VLPPLPLRLASRAASIYGVATLRPTVLFFDVDGTLVDAAGAGRRAMEGALEAHLGPRVRREERWLAGLRLDGMSDRLIIREALLAVGLPFDGALSVRILETYAEILRDEIAGPRYAVLPGVEALLGALSARGALFGLCTGNVEPGARLKLGRGGLERFFEYGARSISGFGSDGEARELIVAAALGRASARLGRSLAPQEALVIGDTPRDISAARAVGCRVLAVATGRFSVEALRAEEPDYAVKDLSQEGAMALLLDEGPLSSGPGPAA